MCSIRLLRSQPASGASPRSYLFSLSLLLWAACSYAGQAKLAWDASTGSSVAGYNIYYGLSSGSYSSKLSIPNQTTYTVPSLQDGQTYYFAVTARDATGKESVKSNEIKYLIPTTTTSTTTGPVPSFTAVPVLGRAPLAVAFSGSATGTVTGYTWNFGDGTTSTQQNVTHTYANPGTYSVSLTATGSGGSNTLTKSGLISASSSTTTTTQCPCTIWSSSSVPAKPSDPDTASVNIGVKFTSSQPGYITGIRFYKSSTNTGKHDGALWTASGQFLGTVTFTNETASGWQQANFATPIPIKANTVYIASYIARYGHYAGDNYYFANTGVTRGPLTALRSGVSGGNGVYKYSSSLAFPTDTWSASNYWVDVVFRP